MLKLQSYLLLLLTLLFAMPASAVLKEDSLGNTLNLLRQELTKYHDEYNSKQSSLKATEQRVFSTLMKTIQSSNENALMLYSQKDGRVFELSYACGEAIEQYRNFRHNLIPFTELVEKSNAEVTRMDSLIKTLRSMPVTTLDERGKIDRNVCLALAINNLRMVTEDRTQLNEYISYYQSTEARLKTLNDYANSKYEDIQNSIFVNGGDDYFSIIKRLKEELTETKQTIQDKYYSYKGVRSQWDVRWIIGLFVSIAFYAVIAILLNQVLVRWLGTKLIRRGKNSRISEWFFPRRKAIILASTAVTFAILLGVVQALADQNFIIMASSLLVQFAWLLSAIIISTLLRVEASKTMNTLYMYVPLLVNCFLVISFRVVLLPNVLVNLTFPPILLVCCLWQWRQLHMLKNSVEKSDRAYAVVTQFFFVVSLACSAIGYTLMSVQILIWWVMQLTCILTITCLRDWFRGLAVKKDLANKKVTETWHYNAIYEILLPTCAVCSVVLSLYWAAEVFNLSDLTMELFTRNFIDTDGFKASIFGIAVVVTLWFVFNYINHTAKALVQYFLEEHDKGNAAQQFMMIKNVLQIVIWGVWFLVTLGIFNVSNQWLVIITGGLSTGVGFASKDILENIYYGVSLMTGRIKIGDLIICDGVRGTVSSISYTSTTIDTVDGSVIAFQNSQLFTKNYRNMTRNHGYESHTLDVGIAYGSNVAEVKKLIIDAVNKLDCIDHRRGAKVVLKGLGDSALELKVIVWVNVFTQFADDGIILECIYNTLNANNIEIPYPQTDIHVRSIPSETLGSLVAENGK